MYGISETDIKKIDKKIEFQKSWLENFTVNFGEKSINMLDNTYSANLNPKKYFAEINNRVNTMVLNAKEQGLKPVFITITAPSKFHIKSAEHWCPYTKLAMVNYGEGIELIDHNKTAKALTQIWNKFTNLQVFQKMKKELNIKLTYFRVYEPHKSGVPHLHALLFLPVLHIIKIKKKFYQYFTKTWGANIGGIGFRYTWYKEKGGAVGYVMKYILKTFKNDESTEIQHSVYWYVKHRVRRFLSSRSLAPLSIYRKVRYYFKNKFTNDYKQVSKLVTNGEIYKEFDDTVISYRYFDYDTGEVEDIILWSKNADLILNARARAKSNTIKLTYTKKETKQIQQQDYEGFANYKPVAFSSYNGMYIVPSKMQDYQLINYYNKLSIQNIDNLSLQHFNLTRNEMIDRDLLNGVKNSLNDIEIIF